MMRARWLAVESKMSLRTLAARMRAYTFTDGSHDGFLLDRTREDRIEGRYIEKLVFQETIPDPFGRELTFDRVTYRQVQFSIYRSFPQLELRNAPRGMQAFMTKLLELCDFDLASWPFTVDVMLWADELSRNMGREVVMDLMQLSEIQLTPTVTSTMTVKSDRDVRDSIETILGARLYTVEKVRLNWKSEARAVVIHLTNNGSAKIEAVDMPLLEALRSALPKPL